MGKCFLHCSLAVGREQCTLLKFFKDNGINPDSDMKQKALFSTFFSTFLGFQYFFGQRYFFINFNSECFCKNIVSSP